MLYVLFGGLGLIFGSFINALVWRLHEQSLLPAVKRTDGKTASQAKSAKKGSESQLKTRADLSILHGRSMCPNCHHTLAAKDLVPVFSWLRLRGRCRYCSRPISWQYPLVELLTTVLFVLAYHLQQPHGFAAWSVLCLWLVATVLLVALSVYDMRWRLLPTRLVYGLTGVALMIVAIRALSAHTLSSFIQAVFAAILLYALFRVLFEVSKGRWLGYGDVRLVVALGLLAGTPLMACMTLFFASFIGTVVALPALIRHKATMTAQIPFGPYLVIGAILVQFWGEKLLRAYWQFIGY